jgi:DNA repair protein RecN (Recombination protein N)
MLQQLTIKNYALIRELSFKPSAQLNVITGETGAGKSIMLGALGLLMGNRSDSKVLWDENEKCVTEGVFDIKNYKLQPFFETEDLDYDDLTVIRREISPGGKSRAFINDTPVTLDVMKKLGSLLMDIHSQHETLQIGNQIFQLRLIDSFAGAQEKVDHYHTQWLLYTQAKKAFERLQKEANSLREEADYIAFQLDELDKASFEKGEQSSLESELQIIEHAAEIKTRLQGMLAALSQSDFSSLNTLREARLHAQAIADYSDDYKNIFNRLESVVIELDDLVNEIETADDRTEIDPQRGQFVQERLSTLYRLLKKHHVENLEELFSVHETLKEKNDITSNVDEALDKAKKAYDKSFKHVMEAGEALRELRMKAKEPLCQQLISLLQHLGIPNAHLEIDFQAIDPTAEGIDKVELLFSANKGMKPRPLSQVASGGEFSRVMFCIKYIMAQKTAMPTLVLDEIDTGISGEVALKLGDMMREMAKQHQVITITHLPQIAAKGAAHYFVYKEDSSTKTISNIRHLNQDERIQEIAKMIGGTSPSKIAIENAQELLNN